MVFEARGLNVACAAVRLVVAGLESSSKMKTDFLKSQMKSGHEF